MTDLFLFQKPKRFQKLKSLQKIALLLQKKVKKKPRKVHHPMTKRPRKLLRQNPKRKRRERRISLQRARPARAGTSARLKRMSRLMREAAANAHAVGTLVAIENYRRRHRHHPPASVETKSRDLATDLPVVSIDVQVVVV